MFWQLWWVWMVAAGLLAILEMLVPAFVFLGFAVGAAVTGLLTLAGVLGSAWAPMVFVFAIASLGGWYLLRALFGRHEGQVKIIDRDINEN